MLDNEQLLSLKEACEWASRYLNKKVTISNISYLIQYGRIKKYGDNGYTYVSLKELKEYYNSLKNNIKNSSDSDINWALSFEQYTEAERTKHVHRLHPYKGKFIPQLVEYFLDSHTDEFKKEIYFNPNDIVLDPFCGSGTTLVQCNELGMHAIGIDISAFNALISNCKISKYNIIELYNYINNITIALKNFLSDSKTIEFEEKLNEKLYDFNNKYFPSPDYKYLLNKGDIDEKKYPIEKEQEFVKIYQNLINEYKIELLQDNKNNFIDKWYIKPIREELEFVANEINKIKEDNIKNILIIILSRTMRSCRATTHSDLATLKQPVYTPYYCHKHGKICKPLFSILKWWETYSKDTIKRLDEFDRLRTDTFQYCITGDSRDIDIYKELEKVNHNFADMVKNKKIKGIFSSPPYVGLINYHEQHAYTYDLFGFERKDALEIGPLYKGQNSEAKDSYVQGISDVLINCKKYLIEDYNVFLVANDKYNLYPIIADNVGMKIVKQYKRPVLNRTEKDKNPYSEIIFHLKEK
ncbi:MAG TPA: DNA methyltransferase [Bacteroidales bacterium]|nr:DNA methyltransferase [Bacteroidales bacterium]HXK91184.1 DNA methyltransferase [Bacteroidales bacterium]